MRVLDLFCGAGGASMGYYRAGFEVFGVDIVPQPNYPFGFMQDDALSYIEELPNLIARHFDLIHASPPCQKWSALATRTGKDYPDLLTPTREKLRALGLPYVIENVPGAPLIDPTVLCGSMFGLEYDGRILKRHRLFESPLEIVAPEDKCKGRPVVGVYGTGGNWTRKAPGGGGVKVSGAAAAELFQVDWTTQQKALAQMIPPAYTRLIGEQVRRQLLKAA